MLSELLRGSECRIIGITGKKGCGKSTFAKELGRSCARPHVRLAFADALRDVAKAVFGSEYRSQEEKAATDAFWAERLGDDWSTGRKILQRLGTEVFREHLNRDIWLHVMELRVTRELQANPNALITIEDVRYDNEAEFIRACGGIIVQLVREDQTTAPVDGHASEAGIDPSFVAHIYACDSVACLKNVAKSFMFCYQGGERTKPFPSGAM